MNFYFDHQKLEAYKKLLALAEWAEPILDRLPKSATVHNQLDRARTSIVPNMPEGNERFTPAVRCKFFDITRGSGLECAGCLDLIFIKNLALEPELEQGKKLLKDMVSLPVGLIRSNSPDWLHGEPVTYRIGGEKRN